MCVCRKSFLCNWPLLSLWCDLLISLLILVGYRSVAVRLVLCAIKPGAFADFSDWLMTGWPMRWLIVADFIPIEWLIILVGCKVANRWICVVDMMLWAAWIQGIEVLSLEETDLIDLWKLGHYSTVCVYVCVCEFGSGERNGMTVFCGSCVWCFFARFSRVRYLTRRLLIGEMELVVFHLCLISDPTQMLNHVTRDETMWDIENKAPTTVRRQSLHRVGLCGSVGGGAMTHSFWISSDRRVIISPEAAVWLHSFLNVSNLANVCLDVLMSLSERIVRSRSRRGRTVFYAYEREEIFSKRSRRAY